MRPKQATSSTALPSRRDVVAALALATGLAAFAEEASADAPPIPPLGARTSPGHVVVLYPNMGHVVIVFPTPPVGQVHVRVDGQAMPDDAIVLEPAASPAPSASAAVSARPAALSAAPAASASAAPIPPGTLPGAGTRFGFYAPAGRHQFSISVDGQGTTSGTADVQMGQSVDVTVDPPMSYPLGGAMPMEHYPGSGCCGGDHAASAASAHDAAPSVAAGAIAFAALLFRRGPSSGESGENR